LSRTQEGGTVAKPIGTRVGNGLGSDGRDLMTANHLSLCECYGQGCSDFRFLNLSIASV